MVEDRLAAHRIGDALTRRGETLAFTESCPGGLLGSTVTGVTGSSDYFLGGVIAYTNQTKRQPLAVSRESLERHGAVSDPVASAIARHVRYETDAATRPRPRVPAPDHRRSPRSRPAPWAAPLSEPARTL